MMSGVELAQLSKELAPSCAPPKDCANAANWVNHELKGLQQVSNSVWVASSNGAVQPTGGPELLFVGGTLGALRLSAAGFGLGAGFDAAGQLATNGTIRPEQSLVAGMTGAVGVSLALKGGVWVPIAGGGAAVANTSFNNGYYGESTSILAAGGLRGVFGVFGPIAGNRLSNYVPSWTSNSLKNTVSNLPGFIPLDNGKSNEGKK